ncbi:MAG TPA: MarR family transcriptional regulator [Planctomycetota bacterium]|nr:MarR family transcriptional regulator [Planctomycetota bacterium]
MATTSRDDARTLEAHAAIEKLTRLTDLFLERREQLASRAGLTDGQWQVLEEISTERFMPSMFARDRDSSRASVSKVLRQLLDRGLARVAVSPKDGRQRTYALTPAGKAALSGLRAEREKAIAAIWLQLDPRELQRFNTFAGDLIARIERYARREEE